MNALLRSLRYLARKPSDPNHVLLGESQIRNYLKDPAASLERLSQAIDEEVKAGNGDKFFWAVIQKFVHRQLNDVVH